MEVEEGSNNQINYMQGDWCGKWMVQRDGNIGVKWCKGRHCMILWTDVQTGESVQQCDIVISHILAMNSNLHLKIK